MSRLLRELSVLAVDCQAGGATPAHGDLLEIGWAPCNASGLAAPIRSYWISPLTNRRVPRAVRELTGWTDACIAESIDASEAWRSLTNDITGRVGNDSSVPVPTVIHFARFELPFLRDLAARYGNGAEFPLDVVCLHSVAARLFPELPRRNIRALAGYLGHSPELMRRSAGHVEATAFIWKAMVPLLEQAGVAEWSHLVTWLERSVPSTRPTRRRFPLAPERRKSLPDRSGVYRFLRRNGDVLYIGKARSLRKRVAGHFKSKGPVTERALELLTQVHDIAPTETASLVEAAMLETDEIKRIDPPYNVQLRSMERSAWFASRDLRSVSATADEAHGIGPLPSERALSALPALTALVEGEAPTPRLRAAALAVPSSFTPSEELFTEGWRGFIRDHLPDESESAWRRLARASLDLWLRRRRTEPEASAADLAPDAWDLPRVRRRLERSLVQTGLLVRRARFLCLLCDATVAFREREMRGARVLVLSGSSIVDRLDVDDVNSIAALPTRRVGRLLERQRAFDAAGYDRLRVLLTELHRVADEGGNIAVMVGGHHFVGEKLSTLLRST